METITALIMPLLTPGQDTKTPKDQLEELKKLNSSTLRYNKIIIGIALATLLASIVGVIIALLK